jgi:carboxypeptidase C (cathepsin A)
MMKRWAELLLASLWLSACDGNSSNTETGSTFIATEVGSKVKPSEDKEPEDKEPEDKEKELTDIPGGKLTADPDKKLTIKAALSFPPKDHVVNDDYLYSAAAEANLPLASVDEAPAIKNHQMMIGGKLVNYTASAGHLIAYAPGKVARASMFYMAYTREDLPRENRPVTFFWNGGPGSSSAWLHLGSWAPGRLESSDIDRNVSDGGARVFSFVDNAETLLDKTDLVFVDPPGTGLSEAIAPYKNSDFWGMEADAQVNRDFVVRFVDRYDRQTSPKYLYGESYDGIRLPVVGNLLAAAGGRNFAPDKRGGKPVALSGIILASPVLDLGTNCSQGGDVSCAGYLPSYAMAADFNGRATRRGTASALEYIDQLRAFVAEKYNPARKIWYSPVLSRAKAVHAEVNRQYDKLSDLWQNAASARKWAIDVETRAEAGSKATELANLLVATPAERAAFSKAFMADPLNEMKQLVAGTKLEIERALTPAWRDYAQTMAGKNFFKDMTGITGLDLDWLREFEVSPVQFPGKLLPATSIGILDARVDISHPGSPAAASHAGSAFAAAIKSTLPAIFNYHNASPYMLRDDNIRAHWKFERQHKLASFRSGLPDLVESLESDPAPRALVLHGYYDLLTPFHQTELDLAGAGLSGRVPVDLYEGGHVFFDDDKARRHAKRTLDGFFDHRLRGR